MAFDAFLKIDGIKGESGDSKHKGEIEIYSYRLGVKQAVHGLGGGSGAGKPAFQDMHFVKKLDAASPALLLACACGTHIKEACFVIRKAGGTQLEYLKVKLTDVLISSYDPGGSAQGADDIPLEEIGLNFGKIEYAYQTQGADGKALGGPQIAGYDVKKNAKV